MEERHWLNWNKMAQNKELENVVLGALSHHAIEQDAGFKLMSEGDVELVKKIIKPLSKVMVDEPHKVRIHFVSIIGYGYDFEGDSAKETYDRAVRYTKKVSGIPNFETFVSDGIVDDRFGWYITSLK